MTNPRAMDIVYIGHQEKNYDLKDFNSRKVTYEDVADILIEGNIVALFQGRSEAGQRALGNRSLLFDSRVQNGRDIVNTVKMRESFRPFAGTIMLEHVHDWFNMRGLKESPYMMFAVDCKKDKRHLIPAILHVDGTCRLQTVTKDQNLHFYNLIEAFYHKTEVPTILNTSFNLAGEPLVETFANAIDTLKRSEIEYLYLPEIESLLYVKNIN